MKTGWLNQGGTWFYLNGSGVMVRDWTAIGGSWYYFNESGAMVTGWLNQGGTWYYFNGSGVMATGTQWIGGERHWFYDSGAWWGLYPVPSAPAAGSGGSSSSAYYKNCDEVRRAGKAPLYRGQPGYSLDLDRDGDGIACEYHRGR